MTDDVVNFTDDIRVPRIDPTHNGYPIDHDKVVSGGKTYYRQRTSSPDGSNATMGAIADAAVVTDASGTLSAKLRGMVKILASVWDSVNGWFRVKAYLHDGAGNAVGSLTDGISGRVLHVGTHPCGWLIASGDVANHTNHRGFGYDDGVTSTLKDINGYSGNTPVPATAILMQVVSSSANDTGTLITSGTSTGGTTTTLIDSGKNFITLGVLAGDFVLNDTDVSLGTIVTVDSATQLTIQPTSELTYALKAYRVVRATSTGAAVLEVHGLDSAWSEISEFVILNGNVAPVPTVNLYIRSNNFHVMVAGSSGAPIGNINLRDNATGTIIYNRIEIGLNISLQAHYTVPAGKVMYITEWHADPSSNKPVRSYLRARADFHDRALIPVFHVLDVAVSGGPHRFDLPIRCPEKCDVKITSQVIGTGTGEVGCGFEFWIEDVA